MKRSSRQSGASRSKAAVSSRRLPVWKKILFSALACLLLLGAIEGGLALFGVKPILYDRDPYVGFAGNVPLFVKEKDAAGREMYVTAKNKTRAFNRQQFPVTKGSKTTRIFCLGGSTTYGHPYDDATSFAGWLRAMLPEADPSRDWEVINCGGISYASYREALVMEELARYQPDLFIILSGHNEFLEHRTYSGIIRTPKPVRGLASLANRTRLSTVARAAAEKVRPAAPTPARHVFTDEVNTMLERVEGPQAYRRDDVLQTNVVSHFKFNLARMADIARSAGAQVVLVSPASNLRDCSPFKSQNDAALSESALRSWQAAFGRAASLYASSNWNGVLSALDQAVQLDARFAQTHYLRGRVLWNLGRFAEARRAFVRSMDEDVCPVRALSSIVDAVGEVAAERALGHVDLVKLLSGLAEQGAPGDDWFLDHVHPTIEGHRRLALALMEEMARLRMVQTNASWNAAAAERIKATVEGRLDAKAHGTALCNVAKVMAWAGKYQEAYRTALRARALSPDDAAIQFEVGKNAGHVRRHDEAIAHLEQALRLNPRFVEAHVVLANTFAARGQFDRAIEQGQTAMKLRPDFPELRSNLGAFLSRAGRDGEAEAEFRAAIRLAPDYAEAHGNLGSLLMRMGRLTEALTHFREAARLKPGLVPPQLGVAWILATHPDGAMRNPNQAIAIGESIPAAMRNEDWAVLDTLAAAYASAGRFPEAVRAQQAAISLAQASRAPELTALMTRLRLYESGQPFREPSR